MTLAQKTNDLCDYGCMKLSTVARGACVGFKFDVQGFAKFEKELGNTTRKSK
jgi:hypothetical protein